MIGRLLFMPLAWIQLDMVVSRPAEAGITSLADGGINPDPDSVVDPNTTEDWTGGSSESPYGVSPHTGGGPEPIIPNSPNPVQGAPTAENGYIAGSYFISWGQYERQYFATDFPATDLNLMVYAFFLVERSGEVVLDDATAGVGATSEDQTAAAGDLQGNFRDICELKKQNRNLKVVMSIGGWSGSAIFSEALSTPEGRNLFVSSSIEHVKNLCLDGVDFDWEWPGIEREEPDPAPGVETQPWDFDPNDGQNLTAVLKGLREGLDAYSNEISNGEYHFLLLAAVAGRPQDASGYDFEGMIPYLDYWMLMAYDLNNPALPSTNKVGHSAPVRTTDADPISAESIITFYEEKGVDPGRMILGQALYGRVFNPASGLGEDFRPEGNDGICRLELESDAYPPQWEPCIWDIKALPEIDSQGNAIEKLYDEEAQAGYAIITDEADPAKNQVISFPTVESVEAAIDLVVERGLAGHFFWESTQDGDLGVISAATAKAASLGQELSTENNNLSYPTSIYPFVQALDANQTLVAA